MASAWLVAMVMLCCHLATGSGQEKVALLVIDVQDCFLSGGSLEVQDGDAVIDVINGLRADYGGAFSLVAFSRDYHCADHVSFASQFPGKQPYDQVTLTYDAQGRLCQGADLPGGFPHAVQCSQVNLTLSQTLWPDHCVKNVTSGATSSGLSGRLTIGADDVIIKKGTNCGVDAYSAFYDNGGFSKTRLEAELRSRDITTVVVTGLATDYCVLYTSVDARRLGFKTYTVLDATRGVALSTVQQAVSKMAAAGVNIITSPDVGAVLETLTSGSCTLTAFGLLLISTAIVCVQLI